MINHLIEKDDKYKIIMIDEKGQQVP